MRKCYLIFGDYPTADNIKDGMIQRIKAVDDELGEYNRIYVKLSLSSLKKKEQRIDSTTTLYCLNILLHYFFIIRLLKQVNAIYFHSILNYKYAILLPITLVPIRFLDFHGAVPEEYSFLGGGWIKYNIIEWIEKQAVKKCTNLICVSYNMREHFLTKYPFSVSYNYIIKPIFPTNMLNEYDPNFSLSGFRESLNIGQDDVVVLYSVNLQVWQNFDVMMEIMNETMQLNYKYIILTGQKEEAIERLLERNIDIERVVVDCVLPTDLYKYYSIAHYGFLLRDEHVLNFVAAPTKLIEYLYYGMIPILKYEEVGDHRYYRYESINGKYTELKHLKPKKSSKNEKIARTILKLASEASIRI